MVRDFQAEHDAEEHRRMLVSRARESSHRRDFNAGHSSEDDEIVMRGRRHDRGRRSGDSSAVAVHALAAS